MTVVGITEIAAILEVGKTRAGQLVEHKEFPRPIANLASGRVWNEAAVRKYAKTRRTAPGRPRRER